MIQEDKQVAAEYMADCLRELANKVEKEDIIKVSVDKDKDIKYHGGATIETLGSTQNYTALTKNDKVDLKIESCHSEVEWLPDLGDYVDDT